MKKIITLILSILYISATSGVMINRHYCLGELTGIGLTHSKDKVCASCGMMESESNGCCNYEQQFLKIDKEQKAANGVYLIKQVTSEALVDNFFELTSIYVPSLVEEAPLSITPRRGQSLPRFIRNRVFRL